MDFQYLESPTRFEELCEQLLLIIHPGIVKVVDGRGGDKGTDSFIGTIDNQILVFQFKHFPLKLDSDHWNKIRKSLETSHLERRPKKWCLLVSAKFTDGDWQKWEQLKNQYGNIELEVLTAPDLQALILKHKSALIPAFPELFPAFENASTMLELYVAKNADNKSQLIRNKPAKFRGERPIWVGRKAYVESIGNLLKETTEPISIIGEGGIGKTSLAFRIMHEFSKHFDVVIPVYFDTDIKYRDFLALVARTMGMKSEEIARMENNELRQHLIDLLAQYACPLIYLDNYELISQETTLEGINDAKHISGFLENMPSNVKILLTSQERSNLDREKRINLEGLSDEEGQDLFFELAKRQFRREPSDEIRNSLQKLSNNVSGHPLSIELLARSYKGGGVTELENMMKHLGLGISNLKSEEQRFMSLQACFDYSLKRLTKKQQQALLKLSMLHSSFSLDMLKLIFTPEITNHVETLYDSCLLRRIESDGEGEFDRLHRMYYFYPAVRTYLDGKVRNSKQDLELLKPRLMLCYSTMILFDIIGHKKSEAERCLNIILEGDSSDLEKAALSFGSPQQARNLFDGISEILFSQRKFDGALKYQIMSYNMNKEVAHADSRLARDIGQIGRILLEQNKYQEAFDKFTESLKLHQELNDTTDVAVDYTNLAEVCRRLGRLDNALDYLKKALAIDQTRDDKLLIASDYDKIGVIYRFMGKLDAALEQHENALTLYRKAGSESDAMYALGNKGITLQLSNKLDDAYTILNEVLEYHKKNGSPEQIAIGHGNIGNVYLKKGNLKEAFDHYKSALEIYSQYNVRSEMGLIYRSLANLFLLAGDIKNALALANAAKQLHNELQDKVEIAADEEMLNMIATNVGAIDQKKTAS